MTKRLVAATGAVLAAAAFAGAGIAHADDSTMPNTPPVQAGDAATQVSDATVAAQQPQPATQTSSVASMGSSIGSSMAMMGPMMGMYAPMMLAPILMSALGIGGAGAAGSTATTAAAAAAEPLSAGIAAYSPSVVEAGGDGASEAGGAGADSDFSLASLFRLPDFDSIAGSADGSTFDLGDSIEQLLGGSDFSALADELTAQFDATPLFDQLAADFDLSALLDPSALDPTTLLDAGPAADIGADLVGAVLSSIGL